MTIELSEEAFTLLYSLRERLVRVRALVDEAPARAKRELEEATDELLRWIGPGVP